MTTRHAGYIVVLDHDIREDDAEQVITALRMVRGVVDVQPVTGDAGVAIAQSRAHFELRRQIMRALDEVFGHHNGRRETP